MKRIEIWNLITAISSVIIVIFIAVVPSISYPRRDAKIEITPRDKIEVYSSRFVRTSDIKGDFSNILFGNKGDIDVEVFCPLTTNENFTGTILDKEGGVSPIEITKGSYEETRRLRITYDLCGPQTEHCDKPELVPMGKHSITFNCECFGCKKRRNFNQTVGFCVYYNNKTKECPD